LDDRAVPDPKATRVSTANRVRGVKGATLGPKVNAVKLDPKGTGVNEVIPGPMVCPGPAENVECPDLTECRDYPVTLEDPDPKAKPVTVVCRVHLDHRVCPLGPVWTEWSSWPQEVDPCPECGPKEPKENKVHLVQEVPAVWMANLVLQDQSDQRDHLELKDRLDLKEMWDFLDFLVKLDLKEPKVTRVQLDPLVHLVLQDPVLI